MSDAEKQALAFSGVNISATSEYHGLAISNQQKQGSKCCGCFCDMRRATIFVSIFFLAISALSLILLFGAESVRQATLSAFDDDALLDVLEGSYLAQSIFVGIGLVTNICSIVGAIQYNSCLVGINIAWMVIDYIATIIIQVMVYNEIEETYGGSGFRMPIISWLIGACVTGLFIYPMASFVVEVRKGIMSRETYAREEHSCCCVSRRY